MSMHAIGNALRGVATWLRRVFRRETKDTPPKVAVRAQPEWTMGRLLDRLDTEHDRFGSSAIYGVIDRSARKALRKLGPHILPSTDRVMPLLSLSDLDAPLFDPGIGYKPAVAMFVGFRDAAESVRPKDGEFVPGNGIYAVRIGRYWACEKTPGTLYVAGATAESDGHEVAFGELISVDFTTGRVYFPRRYYQEIVTLPGRNGARYSRPKYAFDPTNVMESWRAQELYPGVSFADAARLQVASVFAGCLKLWHRRDRYYQVSTRKRRSRVTFCVEPGDHVRFFRDRDRTAIARDGKRKRIVHHVQEHVRSNGQTVKAHLRGIRQFRWHDYNVAVTVPEFHVATHGFDVEPTARPDDENSMSLRGAIERLATVEEKTEYRHGRITDKERGWARDQ